MDLKRSIPEEFTLSFVVFYLDLLFTRDENNKNITRNTTIVMHLISTLRTFLLFQALFDLHQLMVSLI